MPILKSTQQIHIPTFDQIGPEWVFRQMAVKMLSEMPIEDLKRLFNVEVLDFRVPLKDQIPLWDELDNGFRGLFHQKCAELRYKYSVEIRMTLKYD